MQHSDKGPEVFFSYNTLDKKAVMEIARKLIPFGVSPWLDSWSLIPGDDWQVAAEQALERCALCIVCFGPHGLGPRQSTEVRMAVELRDTNQAFRLIPVFLPGVSRVGYKGLPGFLRSAVPVEFGDSAEDEEAISTLLCGVLGKAVGPSLPPTITTQDCPFRGLQVFDVKDARYFFGREAIEGRILSMILPAEVPRPVLRLVSILGPSGSGKSSLARAGVAASIMNGEVRGSHGWAIVVMRPGRSPLESLAISLADLSDLSRDLSALRQLVDDLGKDETTLDFATRVALRHAPDDKRLVLIVDQFEEVFTQCSDELGRKSFIDNLLYVASVIDGRTIVVVTLRADFLGKCTSYPLLAAGICQNQVLVGAMGRSELRSALVEPARLTGLDFESGLVDAILDDAERELGALPLVQHALLELWERRQGARLTLNAYREIGGIGGALEQRAERIYNTLDADERQICRRIFLRLVHIGQGMDVTRRRVPLSELESAAEDARQVDSIIERLAASEARLLTVYAEPDTGAEAYVDISHEALLRNWSQLKNWLEEDRQSLLTQKRLTEACNEWNANGQNAGLLYRGIRLAEASEWANGHSGELTVLEREFLKQSKERSSVEQRLSDAATLDQLALDAPAVWLNPVAMLQWIRRADEVTSQIDSYRSKLDIYDTGISSRQAVDSSEGDPHQFERDTLTTLINRIDRFNSVVVAAARHVATIVASLEALTLESFEREWSLALAAISDPSKSPTYGGLRIRPQKGLVPLGPDPDSRLWEFAYLPTGQLPVRGADGRLVLDEMSAMVLVLVPGGEFVMGAVRPNAEFTLGMPNVDPEALEDESPLHTVHLAPFLLSKYVISQGQWIHLCGQNPSYFTPENDPGVSLLHPVEGISYDIATEALERAGLQLPTEAQWEYAARAGSSTIWWTGNDPGEVTQNANLTSERTTSIARFSRANAFGLHDVAGNVWELCRDFYVPYSAPIVGAEGTRQVENGTTVVSRGGSFFNYAQFARSAIRYFHIQRRARFNNQGCRPSRRLDV